MRGTEEKKIFASHPIIALAMQPVSRRRCCITCLLIIAMYATRFAEAFSQLANAQIRSSLVLRGLHGGCRLRMTSENSEIQPEPDDIPSELAERLAKPESAAAAAPSTGPEEIDWDNAWSSKQSELQDKIAVEQKVRPAFSGRKEIVVTGNKEEGYSYTEIAGDGTRPSDGGFKLAEEDSQARKDIMAKETQLVDAVAFDKVSLSHPVSHTLFPITRLSWAL